MTRPDLPRLGLGCAQLGNLFRPMGDDQADEILAAAWESGIRHFDTAPHYGLGLSEVRLGRFLATKPRDAFVVSTKVGRLLRPDPAWNGTATDADGFQVPARYRRHWDFTDAGVRASLEESLTRLGLDRIDILYVHDPERSGVPDAVSAGMHGLAGLREEGLVRAIGTGSMQPAALQTAAETGVADVLMVANRYTLVDQSGAPHALGIRHGDAPAVVAAAVFNSGLLASSPARASTFDYGDVPDDVLAKARLIESVCLGHDVELATAAMQYPLLDARVTSVVVGALGPQQVRQNVARLGARVCGALWQELDELRLVPRCALL